VCAHLHVNALVFGGAQLCVAIKVEEVIHTWAARNRHGGMAVAASARRARAGGALRLPVPRAARQSPPRTWNSPRRTHARDDDSGLDLRRREVGW